MSINPNAKKLLRTLQPLMCLSQLMGVTFPFHVLKKRLGPIIIYRVIVLSFLFLALLREIPTITFWSRNLRGVHGMLAYIETRVRWFAVIANFLLNSHNNININNTLKKLMNSPLILKQEEHTSIVLYELAVLIFTTFLIASYMCVGHDVLWANPYYAWYSSTIYIITEFYIGFGNLQFIILLVVLRKYYKALNENLTKCDFRPEKCEKREPFVFLFTKECKEDSVREIVKFRKIHMSLTTTSHKMNQCFSLQVLLFLVVSLIEITYSFRALTVYSPESGFTGTKHLNSTNLLEILLIILWAGYYIWSILQVVFSCETTIIEANRTKGIVHELLNKIDDADVTEQTMNQTVEFSAGKFVTLNFPLLNSIIGTITTYLIIIKTFSY